MQFLQPLFEFPGACAGCGETPYIKLLSQLFGDRLVVANATGCSSIYGGNLPTTPWSKNNEGRGPAWSNSLFEYNAEFGLGFRLAADQHLHLAQELLQALRPVLGDERIDELLSAPQIRESEIQAQRARVAALKERLIGMDDERAERLLSVADQVDTRTAAGRLVLNVLLSFAQFEREIIGERIRDKIAASKRCGLWMGGQVPMGYDPDGRTLKINDR